MSGASDISTRRPGRVGARPGEVTVTVELAPATVLATDGFQQNLLRECALMALSPDTAPAALRDRLDEVQDALVACDRWFAPVVEAAGEAVAAGAARCAVTVALPAAASTVLRAWVRLGEELDRWCGDGVFLQPPSAEVSAFRRELAAALLRRVPS